MNFDWVADVRKYAPDADQGVIAQIILYCAVPLKQRGTWQSPIGDLAQTGLIREHFLRQTLGVTGDNAELDRAIAQVRQRMGGDIFRNRVTVYYLLAERFGRLGVFAAPPVAPVAIAPPAAPVEHWRDQAGAATAPLAEDAPAHSLHADDYWYEPEEPVRSKWGWLLWLLLGLAVLALLLWLVGWQPRLGIDGGPAPQARLTGAEAPPSAAPTPGAAPSATVAAPVAAASPPAPPATEGGAGVVSQNRNGKPVVNVFFRSGSAWLVPAFRPAVQELKGYIAAHPGATLTVSGFADKWGNADTNLAIAAERANRVKAALIAAGVPETAVSLVKPANSIDSTGADGAARRVEIVAK